jgi:hypothetical protein
LAGEKIDHMNQLLDLQYGRSLHELLQQYGLDWNPDEAARVKMIGRLTSRTSDPEAFAKRNFALEKVAGRQERLLSFFQEPFEIVVKSESDLKLLVDDVLAVAGHRPGDGAAFADLLIEKCGAVPEGARVLDSVDVKVFGATSASALGGFAASWRKARKLPGPKEPVEDERDAVGSNAREKLKGLVRLAAANDLVGFGTLLGATEVNSFDVWRAILPESVVRRPERCRIIDVAVGSGSVEMSKYLLEFHAATPSRETLRMAISTGNRFG